MWVRFKRWFHEWGSPSIFVGRMDAMMPWCFTLGLVGMVSGWIWGLFFTPPDYLQGDSYRIMHIHVPAAAIGMSAYAMMAVNGFVGLVWKIKVCFSVMKAIAPIGMIFSVICLVTGSLWGRPTWGTYWEWDARLTSMLVLVFLYIGFMALDSALGKSRQGDTACALLALVGAINLPIIKYSVNWWNTLHQEVTFKVVGTSTIDPSMKWPMYLALFSGFFFFTALVCWHGKWRFIATQSKSQWLKDYWRKP